MRKIFNWIKQSNRYKHLIGGCIIGLFACSWFTAVYASGLVGVATEYKDKAHGGKFDWIDAAMTLLGGIIGRGIAVLSCNI